MENICEKPVGIKEEPENIDIQVVAQLQAQLQEQEELQEQMQKQKQEQKDEQKAEQRDDVTADGNRLDGNHGNNTSTNTLTAVTGNNYNIGKGINFHLFNKTDEEASSEKCEV